MNNISVLRWDNSLNEYSHENLVKTDTKFLGRKESSFVEFTCPDSFDGVPGLIELAFWNTKLNQLIFEEPMMRILTMELHAEDDLFASMKILVHLFDTLALHDLINKRIESVLLMGLKTDRVFLHLERDASALGQLDPMVEFISHVLEIV